MDNLEVSDEPAIISALKCFYGAVVPDTCLRFLLLLLLLSLLLLTMMLLSLLLLTVMLLSLLLLTMMLLSLLLLTVMLVVRECDQPLCK